jgi:hypothetical protein
MGVFQGVCSLVFQLLLVVQRGADRDTAVIDEHINDDVADLVDSW